MESLVKYSVLFPHFSPIQELASLSCGWEVFGILSYMFWSFKNPLFVVLSFSACDDLPDGVICHIVIYSDRREGDGGGGEVSPALFRKLEKKCPNFGKKCPEFSCNSMIKNSWLRVRLVILLSQSLWAYDLWPQWMIFT